MNPSRPFILRPVATSLLMAGDPARRHRRLPAAAGLGAAAGGLSDDSGRDVLSGRQPGRDGLGRHRAARAAVRPGAGPEPDDVDQLRRRSVITLQFVLDLEHRRRRAGGAGGDQRGGHVSAGRPAEPADLQQDQPGRRADPDAGADVEDAAAVEGRRPRRHAAGAEDLAAARRRAGQHQRRAEAGGPHPGEPDRAVVATA